MILLDTLLLEPYRDPREVWLAIRTDGQAGSGTLDDPFNASTIPYPQISISSLGQVSGDTSAALALMATSHGFKNDDRVTVFGAVGQGSQPYNGTFQVYAVTANSFRYRMISAPVDATAQGTLDCWRERERFDALMREMPAQTVIHFGPGTYETKGFSGQTAGSWQPKPGQRFRGSGMAATTLKLVNASSSLFITSVFGANWDNLLDYFEASDFTVNCNLGGQPVPQGLAFAPVACGAIVLLPGRHQRVRRLRVVNFGTQTSNAECFAIVLGGMHPALPEIVDCVIEDCIAEQPSWNNVRETTVLGFGGTGMLPEEKPSYHRGCVRRRNLVDCTYWRNEVPIQRIERIGEGDEAVARVTTVRPHDREAGNWVVIAGAIVDGTELNSFNGSYEISNHTATTFEYTPKPTMPESDPTGTMFVDRFPSHYVPAGNNSIVQEDTITPGADPNQYRLTTETPHNRIPGNNVVITGVWVSVPDVGDANAFNDSHLVEAVPSPTELIFTPHPTDTRPVGTINWTASAVKIGVQFHLGAGGGTCEVLEHNRVIGATMGAYSDTGSTRSLHIRKNDFHRVRQGVYRNLAGYRSPSGPIAGACLTYSKEGSTHLATFTTIEPHGLSVNDAVSIGGASVPFGQNNPYSSDPNPTSGENYNPNNPYNSVGEPFQVVAVPSPNQFQYELPSMPPGFGTSPNVPTNAGGSPVFSSGGTLDVVTAVSLTRDPDHKKIATFTSATPQGFNVGDIVSVFGAQMISSESPPAFSPTYYNPYNGLFVIRDVGPMPNPTWFTYLMTYEALDNARTDGSGGVAPPKCARQLGTPLTRNGTTATFRTVRPHFLEVGQIVWMDVALVAGSDTNPFYGKNLVIKSVGLTSFTYEMTAVPAANAYGLPGYHGKDIEGLLQIENNVFELVTNLHTAGHLRSSGAVGMGAGNIDFRPKSVFRQVSIRGNVVRHVDQALDQAGLTSGLDVDNGGVVLLHHNVFAINQSLPIQFHWCGMVSCVNNRTREGAVVPAYDKVTNRAADLYFPAAEDATVLALL